ncbi:MAG: DedA family protein [Mangrovibacterium sp.]
MPVELAFIYYLQTDLNMILLNLIAIGTALFSQGIDYYIGRSFSKQIIDRLIGRQRYEKAAQEIRRYGNIAIFFFNLLPLSSPVILLAAGMLKHRLKEAFLYSLAGLLLKYLLMTLIFG